MLDSYTQFEIRRAAGKTWAVAHMHVRSGDVSANEKEISLCVEWAMKHKADALILPELCVSGYAVGDDFFRPAFRAVVQKADAAIAQLSSKIPILWGSFVPSPSGKLYNVAHTAENGAITSTIKKTLLPMGHEFDEARWFDANPGPCRSVSFAGVQVGVLICKDVSDQQSAQKPCEELFRDGAQVLLHPAAETFFVGKTAQQEKVYASVQSRTGLNLITARAFGAISLGKSIHLLRGAATAGDTNTKTMRDVIVFVLRSFWKKSHLKTAVIGVSGGIDSAVTMTLTVEALGAQNVLGVHMPSQFTSQASTQAAQDLCDACGVPMRTIPIDTFVEEFSSVVKNLSALNHQNLQARIRGTGILSLIASTLGGAHICTGNRTEATFGYTTLYGDAAGAVSPLGDCSKADVYALATLYGALIPKYTKNAQPTAELGVNQSDPFFYPYHDQLARAFTIGRQTPADLILLWDTQQLAIFLSLDGMLLQNIFTSREAFIADLECNWKRYRSTSFKRAQMPPVLAIRQGTFGTAYREIV